MIYLILILVLYTLGYSTIVLIGNAMDESGDKLYHKKLSEIERKRN